MRQDDSCLFCCDCREQLVTAAAEPGKPGDKAKKGFVSSPRIYYLYSIISKAGRMKDSSRFNKKLEGGNVWMNMARKIMGLLLMVTLILTAGLVWAEQPKPKLVNITEVNPRILIDLRYATTNNFLKQKVYPNGFQCLLLEPLAQKLNQAQLLLEKTDWASRSSTATALSRCRRRCGRLCPTNGMWRTLMGAAPITTGEQQWILPLWTRTAMNWRCPRDLMILPSGLLSIAWSPHPSSAPTECSCVK